MGGAPSHLVGFQKLMLEHASCMIDYNRQVTLGLTVGSEEAWAGVMQNVEEWPDEMMTRYGVTTAQAENWRDLLKYHSVYARYCIDGIHDKDVRQVPSGKVLEPGRGKVVGEEKLRHNKELIVEFFKKLPQFASEERWMDVSTAWTTHNQRTMDYVHMSVARGLDSAAYEAARDSCLHGAYQFGNFLNKAGEMSWTEVQNLPLGLKTMADIVAAQQPDKADGLIAMPITVGQKSAAAAAASTSAAPVASAAPPVASAAPPVASAADASPVANPTQLFSPSWWLSSDSQLDAS